MLALSVAQGHVSLSQHDEGELISVTCPRCRGRDEACTRCQGGGEEVVTVEEIRRAVSRHDVRDALSTWTAYRNAGHLPAAGAFLDQSRAFHDVIRLLDGELARDRASEQNRGGARRA